MPERPFLQLYPQDWRGDETLRICSLAARGLWMECMCLMHFATPYGHLLVNGKPVTETQLSALVGCPQDQISALLAELENAGVSSKTRDGVIYSRRMTRDARKRANAKKNGRLGGNPKLVPSEGVNLPDNQKDKLRGQSPEARKNPKEVIEDLALSLKGRKSTWTREQKKAAWQSILLQWVQRTKPEAEYLKFYEGLLNGEEWAERQANVYDKQRKAMAA